MSEKDDRLMAAAALQLGLLACRYPDRDPTTHATYAKTVVEKWGARIGSELEPIVNAMLRAAFTELDVGARAGGIQTKAPDILLVAAMLIAKMERGLARTCVAKVEAEHEGLSTDEAILAKLMDRPTTSERAAMIRSQDSRIRGMVDMLMVYTREVGDQSLALKQSEAEVATALFAMGGRSTKRGAAS